ncbi:protein of unknown function [Arthrobacter sp. ok362]|nr:protein of unknown function [Arthrobacter sp. ok362]
MWALWISVAYGGRPRSACHTQSVTTSYAFRAELWHYPEQAGWHFITLPPELAEQLKDEAAPFRKGFGSVKVSACIAGQRWSTSLFPDSKSNSYLLPVKKAIRTAASIRAGDEVDVEVDLELPG